MTLSVVVISRNEGEWLARTLDSLMPTLPASSEVVVVDDGSDDGSADSLKQPVHVLRAEGIGVARARNLGARQSTGDVIVFADAHMEFSRDWWEPLVDLVLSRGNALAASAIASTEDREDFGYGFTLDSPELELSWFKRPSGDSHRRVAESAEIRGETDGQTRRRGDAEIGRGEMPEAAEEAGSAGSPRRRGDAEIGRGEMPETAEVAESAGSPRRRGDAEIERGEKPEAAEEAEIAENPRTRWGRPTVQAAFSPLVWDTPFHAPVLPGTCLAMPRRVFEETGGFDEGLRSRGGVDAETGVRFWLLGYECWVVPESRVWHYFRRSAPYPVRFADVMHNGLRLALLHFNRERIAAVRRAHEGHPYFEHACRLLAPRELAARRRALRARRVHDDSWFFDKFDISW